MFLLMSKEERVEFARTYNPRTTPVDWFKGWHDVTVDELQLDRALTGGADAMQQVQHELIDRIKGTDAFILELRLWASHRGQTLARTMRGMMYNNRAMVTTARIEDIYKHAQQPSMGQNDTDEQPYTDEQYNAMAQLKFTFVVSCQIFGQMQGEKEPNPNPSPHPDTLPSSRSLDAAPPPPPSA